MAVMTLYKRTNELQWWQTTPAMMNSTDEPASFNSGDYTDSYELAFFNAEFALLKKMSKSLVVGVVAPFCTNIKSH